MEFLGELGDEVKDFFEDFWEHLTEGKVVRSKETKLGIRPAYLFAERIDNLVKLTFGA